MKIPLYRHYHYCDIANDQSTLFKHNAVKVAYKGHCFSDQKGWKDKKQYFSIEGKTVSGNLIMIHLDLENAKKLKSILNSFIKQAKKELNDGE